MRKGCDLCKYWNPGYGGLVAEYEGWGFCPKHNSYTMTDDQCGLFKSSPVKLIRLYKMRMKRVYWREEKNVSI